MQMQQVRGVATAVYPYDGETHVRYHQTLVVRFDDDKVILDSGGWRTATTKARMNQAAVQFKLGYHVFQEKGEWFVVKVGHSMKDRIPFSDGMVIER